MTTSNGENKATKKPPPRPAMYRRHSFDTCSLPPHASPASSPSRAPETSAPTTPNKCSTPTKMMSFPELLPSSNPTSTRSRRHTMSNFDGGYARYDEASGKMQMMSPPPPPSRKRQSISVGDVSGLLLPPPAKMTGQESKKVAGKDTSHPSPQQGDSNDATAPSSGIASITDAGRKFPAMMPPRPPFEDDDQHMEDISSSGHEQDDASPGGNVRYRRRMSIGSILGPIVAGPPAVSPPDPDDAAGGSDGDDDEKPSGEGDSTTLLSLEDLHVSSKRAQSSHQGPSPRSSAVI